MMKTWFVTGANRGLGFEMAKAAHAAGDNVVGTARDITNLAAVFEGSGRFLAAPLDVTDAQQIDVAVAAAQARFGRIDVLVNNAGYGQTGWFEAVSDQQIRQQFDTNVHGVMNVTRAILPIMRAQRSGHVFSVTSSAGIAGYAGYSAYCASKFAVEGWMESLALEVAPLGIRSTLIEPGPFKTDFYDPSSLKGDWHVIDDYAGAIGEARLQAEQANHRQPGDPVKLADAVLALARMETPPMHFGAGAIAVDALLRKADALRADVEAHRELSLGTDAP